MDYYSPFWGPEAIFIVVEPQGALTCRSSTLIVLADSGRFLDYYSLFWGPKVISTINEPRGAFTCRSSALTVLANSGPFCGLLLTILGSYSDFHDERTPGCVYVSVINTHIFCRIWSVSNTITHRFEVPKRYPWVSNPKVRLRVGHQHSHFWPILARFVDYHSSF